MKNVYEFVMRPIFNVTRRQRMRNFQSRMGGRESLLVLDVGGTCFNWRFVDRPYKVTLLNLYPCQVEENSLVEFESKVGNGCELPFEDDSFDVVFSNSVIEHVGDFAAQQQFAREMIRVGKSVWIQTPAQEFFMEPHFLMPIVHWLPDRYYRMAIRYLCLRRFIDVNNQKHIDETLDEVRLLKKAEVQRLFPNCEILVERFLGWPKSYIAIRS